MFGYFKKLIKKSLGLKEKHPFGQEKTHVRTNGIAKPVKINQVNKQNTRIEQIKDFQVDEPQIHPKNHASKPNLILYKFDACPYCKRVQRKITELNISDEIEMRDTRTEPIWRQDLQEQTGRTQVPCLFIDGEPMFESLDIIDYLQMQFTSTS